jgi:hypothetical protein
MPCSSEIVSQNYENVDANSVSTFKNLDPRSGISYIYIFFNFYDPLLPWKNYNYEMFMK